MKEDAGGLVLGTAQLGMCYGIRNRTGRPDPAGAAAVVGEAWECGIREFDTARRYGESEAVLGKVLSDLGISDEARVITKLDPDLDHLDGRRIERALEDSLGRLGIDSLYGLMLHREELLSVWDRGLGENLMSLVSTGRVEKVGASVYSPSAARTALTTDGIDLVQIPTNILDRRFEKAGVFRLARERGKVVYIRSVFLQGLLLMEADELPERMAFARPVIVRLSALANDLGVTKKELALGYIRSEIPDARVVFGAETARQVEENAAIWHEGIKQPVGGLVQAAFLDVDERILNPALWPRAGVREIDRGRDGGK